MRFFSDENIVLRAKAAGIGAPLESWSKKFGWESYGVTVKDVQFIRTISSEQAAAMIRQKGASATEANKAVAG